MPVTRLLSTLALLLTVVATRSAPEREARVTACSFSPPDSMPPLFTEAWVRWTVVQAEAVVRARVIGPAPSVADTSERKPRPGEQIAVQVLELISGAAVPSLLFLPGTLYDVDLYPREPIPYLTAGSSPACHRAAFRNGGEHLLLLWQLPDSVWTAEWMPHAPSMIQVRGPADPWIAWVRAARTERPVPGA
jgi:hypothetical protein